MLSVLHDVGPRVQKLFGSSRLARYRSVAARIEKRAADLKPLSDESLRQSSLSLRYEALAGRPLDDLLPEAFALVREAATRSVGMTHYRVQLIGGIAMFDHNIVVMQTGEGKTLTATLPMYLAALTQQGAHLATANDYLAQRDAELMKPVYESLGLSIGTVVGTSSRADRRSAYACDVTYSTAKEIGFDFLRDRLFTRHSEESGQSSVARLAGMGTQGSDTVQRQLNFMLIDEADSILIDEARTPLIVSSTPDEVALARSELFRWSVKQSERFFENKHYTIDEKSNSITLTGDGRRMVRSIKTPSILARTPMMDIYEQIETAIYVENNYAKDRHYVVQDSEIVIVDEFTGRLADGRRWQNGIHQTIEAREGLEPGVETGQSARITIQDLFLKYSRIAGMTGTVANSAGELKSIYKVGVVDVPTNKPPQRKRWSDIVLGTDSEKWKAIAGEVAQLHQAGRPVLVGTRSIDKSEQLAAMLSELGVACEILNARHLAREAEIVVAAGQPGKVTVATNMAGRGTDIRISDATRELGGLHVIITERHESARIDRQLVGRCGRQGDPGSFRYFLSLEDEILKNGLGEKAFARLQHHSATPSNRLSRFAPLFAKAQRKIERRHFKSRALLLYNDSQRQELQREMGQDPWLDTAGA